MVNYLGDTGPISNIGTRGQTTSNIRTQGQTTSNIRTQGQTTSNIRTRGQTTSNIRTQGQTTSNIRTQGQTTSNIRTRGSDRNEHRNTAVNTLNMATIGLEHIYRGHNSLGWNTFTVDTIHWVGTHLLWTQFILNS